MVAEIPLFFSNRDQTGKTGKVLAGDVGGTKTNLAVFAGSSAGISQGPVSSYHSSQYPSITAILQQFLREHPDARPDRIVLGVAGPVFEGKAEITNLGWDMDSADIRLGTGIGDITLLNDLEATAYGLAGLQPGDFACLCEGDPKASGNMAVLAPGTGLGEAILYFDGEHYRPFATEGGHCDFGPRTREDFELHDFMLNKYKVVSWESVLAGSGIHGIYEFLTTKKGRPADRGVAAAFEKDDPSAVISETAIAGADPVCAEAMAVYIRYLGRECANLVLKSKATGGLFLAGGIPPKILALLKRSDFYTHFLDTDRMADLVRKVPVHVVLNQEAPMIGAGWYGSYAMPALKS